MGTRSADEIENDKTVLICPGFAADDEEWEGAVAGSQVSQDGEAGLDGFFNSRRGRGKTLAGAVEVDKSREAVELGDISCIV